MNKYYRNIEGEIHELVPDANNTIEQLLSFNPDLIEEVTFEDFQAQDIVFVKEAKCSQINQRTEELIVEGFIYNGVQFEMKIEDQLNINTLFSLLNNGMSMAGQYFRAAEEDYYFESDEDFLGLIAAGSSYKSDYIESGAVLKNSVKACTTIEEVEEIEDTR